VVHRCKPRPGYRRFIARYDGQWYWEGVDPSLSDHRTGSEATFEAECRVAMKELVDEKLVELRPNVSLDPPERYWLTEDGRQAAARLADV
jgi:hypothetical protein